MLLVAILLPILSAYNIDTVRYVVLDGKSGEFGYSLATSSDKLFVSAPKDNELKGALYTCELDGLKQGESAKTADKSEKCSPYSKIPRTEDSERITVTNQGLGETLTINRDEKKLVICAPRYKSRNFSFCEMSDQERLTNARGICYEINIDKDDVPIIHDYCRGSEWRSVGGANSEVELQAFESENVCLQFRNSDSSQISDELVFHLEGGSKKVLAIKYATDKKLFELTFDSQKSVQISCEPNRLAISLLLRNALRFYCNGRRQSQKLDLSLEGLVKTTLKGPSQYWAEGFQSFTLMSDRRKKLQNLDTCMLGYSAKYDPDNNLVLAAPGYNLNEYSGSYSGSLFFGGNLTVESGDDDDWKRLTDKGLTYRSTQFVSDVWAVVSGFPKDKSLPNRGIMILKNKVFHSFIEEETPLTRFGTALLLWKSKTRLQLIVSAPFSAHNAQADCGVVYVYTLQNSERFKLEHTIRSVCGGFGATIEDVGDLDGDGFTDIAVGASYDNSVHIIRGSSDGLQTSISQSFRPKELLQNYVNVFGFAVSGHNGIVAVSDPIFNKVYIYRTLEVLESSNDVACGQVLHIDADPGSVSCKICTTLRSRSGNSASSKPVNITVTWTPSNENVTENGGETSKIIGYTADKTCVNVDFARRSKSDIRSFDLSNDLELRFSFRQGPDPETGRTVAIAPETLVEETRVIKTTGRCGEEFCEADFSLEVDWGVARWEPSGTFQVISRDAEISDKRLYYGSGKEALQFNVTVKAISGHYIDEILVLDLGKNFAVRSAATNCNDFRESTKITMSIKEDKGLCSSNAAQCDTALYLSCNTFNHSDNVKKMFHLHIPLVQSAYLMEELRPSITIQAVRNRELNFQNNVISTTVQITNVLDLEVTSGLQPADQTNIRLREFKSSSTTLQGYGPEQTLLIQLKNKGEPAVKRTDVAVLYPVFYKEKEMMYISNLTITTRTFNCSTDTYRAINHRNLVDIYETDAGRKKENKDFPALTKCNNDWMCVNLVCSVGNVRQNKPVNMVVKSYLNAEAASFYPNISFSINYTTKIMDIRMITAKRTTFGEIKSIVAVRKSASVLWYIVGAAVGGSLLFLLLTVALFRCGFFRRSNRDQVKRLKNAEVEAAALTSVAEVSSVLDQDLSPENNS